MFKIKEVIKASSKAPKHDIKTEIQRIVHNFYDNGVETGFVELAVSESIGVDFLNPGEASRSISRCQTVYKGQHTFMFSTY